MSQAEENGKGNEGSFTRFAKALGGQVAIAFFCTLAVGLAEAIIANSRGGSR